MGPLTEQEKFMGYHFWYRSYPFAEMDDEVRPFLKFAASREPWLRRVRNALFLPPKVAANRLQMTPSALTAIERREAEGMIRLKTLKECAEAVDCELVYALVPK